ncbi:MAG TPA: TonB-dependent receptor [Saprospiraceae bacterium]|nr:TonB-dependent receptor [Saprospiraceae bacterium]
MERFIFLAVLIFCCSFVKSQVHTLTGTVVDSSDVVLEWASIVLYHGKDSTMVGFAYSDGHGVFRIKNIKSGSYILQIAFLGKETFMQDVIIDRNLDLGKVRLRTSSMLMDEVEITGFRIPVLIKNDTVEYLADAFSPGLNANVEDLLKRMPGIDIDHDGNIKAQGEDVKQVLVDGKRFFGNDPKIATKNLPADAVDKVQVYDSKSEIAEFTGVDDGSREKTINLKLKEDKKNGMFGYGSTAFGPDTRHDQKLSLNRFTDKLQFSILGGGNNINQQGFSMQDYMNFSGMGGGMAGGGTVIVMRGNNQDGPPISMGPDKGFTSSWNGGLQLNSKYGKDRDFHINYFYNRADQQLGGVIDRTSFLPNGASIHSLEDNSQNIVNINHRLQLNWEHAINPKSSLKLNSSVSFTESQQMNESHVDNINIHSGFDNSSNTNNTFDGNGVGFNGLLSWRYRLSRRGRFASATLQGRYSQNRSDGYLDALNSFMMNGITLGEELLNQNQIQLNNQNSLGAQLLYTEPFGDRNYLDFQYNFHSGPMRNNREVFDIIDEHTLIINEILTNSYKATFTYHSPGLQYRRVRDKWSFHARLHLQYSQLDGEIQGVPEMLSRDFTYLLPSLSANFPFSNTRNLNVNYTTSIREPSVLQLQPVPDNRDPLNIYIGNPELNPEYVHRLSARFTKFNSHKLSSFFIFSNISFVSNRIRESITIDEQLVRTRHPVNVDGEWDLFSRISYGWRIPRLKLNFNVTGGVNFNRGISFVNEVENTTKRMTPMSEVRIIFNIINLFELEGSTSWNLTTTRYSLQSELNQQFSTWVHRWNLRTLSVKGWQGTTGLFLSQFRGDAGVFNQDIPIWTASLSRFIKGNKAEIKIIANDLLNKNVGITRTSDLNFIQDEEIISLGRYGLLQLRINFNAWNVPQGGTAIFRSI